MQRRRVEDLRSICKKELTFLPCGVQRGEATPRGDPFSLLLLDLFPLA